MSACVECGAKAEEYHHVVPKSLGGNFTVALCSICHGKVHDIPDRGGHRELCRRGQDKLMVEELCAVWWHVFVLDMPIADVASYLDLRSAKVRLRMERLAEMSDDWRETLFTPIVGELRTYDFSLHGMRDADT